MRPLWHSFFKLARIHGLQLEGHHLNSRAHWPGHHCIVEFPWRNKNISMNWQLNIVVYGIVVYGMYTYVYTFRYIYIYIFIIYIHIYTYTHTWVILDVIIYDCVCSIVTYIDIQNIDSFLTTKGPECHFTILATTLAIPPRRVACRRSETWRPDSNNFQKDYYLIVPSGKFKATGTIQSMIEQSWRAAKWVSDPPCLDSDKYPKPIFQKNIHQLSRWC